MLGIFSVGFCAHSRSPLFIYSLSIPSFLTDPDQTRFQTRRVRVNMFYSPHSVFHDAAAMPFANNPYASCSPYGYSDYNIYSGASMSLEEQPPVSLMTLSDPQPQQQLQQQQQQHDLAMQDQHQSLSRKRAFHESDADFDRVDSGAAAFRVTAPIKRRSEKPIETHIHGTQLFENAVYQI